MSITWKFVDTPVAVPATLLDLNDPIGTGSGITLNLSSTFNISPPALRRNVAENNMSDGGVLTSAAYENRVLQFSVIIRDPTRAGKIAKLKALTDEIAKPYNLLMYKADATQPPVFFRTMRSDDYAIDNSGGSDQEVWKVDLAIQAEPFAIGIRRDLSTIAISNDAISGTNPIHADITGIVGDSPTPAFIQMDSVGVVNGAYIIATRALNNPTSLTLASRCADANNTLSNNTTSIAQSPAGWATTGNVTQTTFGSLNSLLERVRFSSNIAQDALPRGSDTAALRGRYRVFLRCAASTASNFSLRFVQIPNSGSYVRGPVVQVDLPAVTTTNPMYVDLGILEYPPPQPVPQYVGYSGLQNQFITTGLAIEAVQNSGSGNLLMDYVTLMPADERMCAVSQVGALSGIYYIIDGPNDATYAMANTDTFGSTRAVDMSGGLVPHVGGLPMLVPGLTNRWYLLTYLKTITANTNLTISYWPRWREVATV